MPYVDFSSLTVRARPGERRAATADAVTLAIAKAAVLFFVVAILQVTIVSSIGILGGSPDLVLVTLVAVSLTQGSIFGAVSGFWAGLLLDIARLGTLGFTSLLLTLAGFWIGRYGETTGRDRAHAPLLSVAVVTVLYAVGSLVMHFLLREPALGAGRSRRRAPGDVALNLLLTFPVFCARQAPVRRRQPAAGGGVRWLAARSRSARALPAARPAGRRSLPAHAAARLPDRDPRLPRARRVRRPLRPPLVAAGALGERVPRRGAEQPAPPAAPWRRRAARSRTATAACSSRTRARPP